MNNGKIIEVCRRISKCVNSLSDIYYTSESLQKALKISCCPYYVRVSGVLLKSGIDKKNEGRIVSFKIGRPTHYSLFIPTIRKRFEQRISEKNHTNIRSIELEELTNSDETLSICIFSDIELVQELRRRGFETSATKKIEL